MATPASAEAWAPPGIARVLRRRAETRDVVTLELETGEVDFAPGQFNLLSAFGQPEVPISISGGTPSGRLVHTIRAVGAATRALCALRAGDAVGWRGPFGRPWPLAEARGRDLVIVAGGVGLPPLRPVITSVLADRDRYGRVALLYGARSPADLVFRQELPHWRSRFDFEVQVTVDAADETWRGRVGVVTRLIAAAGFDEDHVAAFVCGPEAMMRFAVAALRDRDVDREAIWVSLERNMHCASGVCGHCQLGPLLVCRDGPVFRWDRVESLLGVREL